ncbi:MAG: flagellar hook-basal body complex protein, partial [Pseudazoarcus pumilus]|nr:flagellar hook-basal body complex protein [Pseudazoarcus pumilus]
NGQFEVDADGFITTPQGERLQGVQAVNGVVNPNGALTSLIIPSEPIPARATVDLPGAAGVRLVANLDAEQTPAVQPQPAWPAFDPADNTTYDAQLTQVSFLGNDGNTKTVDVYLRRQATGADDWEAFYVIDAGDGVTPQVVSAGNLLTNGTSATLSATVTNTPPDADQALDLNFNWDAVAGWSLDTDVDTVNVATEALPDDTAVAFLNPTLAVDPTDTASYNATTSLTVYDSLGLEHTLSLYFAREPGTNDWQVWASLDGGAVQRLNNGTDGTLSFNTSGIPTGGTAGTSFTFPATDLGPEVDPLSFTVDLARLTQFGDPFSVTETGQNGYTQGSLVGISVDRTGTIQGRYSNNRTQALGQVQLMTFTNPNGLVSLGNNLWESTPAAGANQPQPPGAGLNGVISSGVVEDSNVDLTRELVQLIIMQRNYQANAQSIRTQDQLLQTVVNLR